jgi:hypothetical protein
MRYGNSNRHDEIAADSFVSLSEDLGIGISHFVKLARITAKAAIESVFEIASDHTRKFPKAGIYHKILEIIEKNIVSLDVILNVLSERPKPYNKNQHADIKKPGDILPALWQVRIPIRGSGIGHIS